MWNPAFCGRSRAEAGNFGLSLLYFLMCFFSSSRLNLQTKSVSLSTSLFSRFSSGNFFKTFQLLIRPYIPPFITQSLLSPVPLQGFIEMLMTIWAWSPALKKEEFIVSRQRVCETAYWKQSLRNLDENFAKYHLIVMLGYIYFKIIKRRHHNA